ncbi:hypothetical protein ACFE04_024857 [Oxalis oulophora]
MDVGHDRFPVEHLLHFLALAKDQSRGADIKAQATICAQYKIAVTLLQWYGMYAQPFAFEMFALCCSDFSAPIYLCVVRKATFLSGHSSYLHYLMVHMLFYHFIVFWTSPPPLVDETELNKWPLNFLESKLTAGTAQMGNSLLAFSVVDTNYLNHATGINSCSSGFNRLKEFFQYLRESKFIHATCLNFTLLSAFAPFCVYNDMTARKCISGSSFRSCTVPCTAIITV